MKYARYVESQQEVEEGPGAMPPSAIPLAPTLPTFPTARLYRLCNGRPNPAFAPELLGSQAFPRMWDPAYIVHPYRSGFFVADAGW